MDLFYMSAGQAAAAIRAGEISSEELVGNCLDRIAAQEGTVQAWTCLDPEHALAQARRADAARAAGDGLGPLHGLPVGVKDIFDTCDMPTENGSVLHAGRRPDRDSRAVTLLREAGAVIMGKTVTTEFAVFAPGKTTNPHDPRRTPGGSSMGSAAAVAAHMVPLAIGSQTNGSTIRPASFCGIYGYKPSHGLVPRTGVLLLSRVLDHVGLFARTIEDLALLGEQLMAFDADDPDTRPRAGPELLETTSEVPPTAPRLALARTPHWDEAADDTRDAFAELAGHLGGHVVEIDLPEAFGDAVEWHRTILDTDLATNLAREYETGRERLSGLLRGMIEHGQGCLAVDYNRAVAGIAALNAELEGVFGEYDAILTPAAPGEAPIGLEATGNPIFSTIWTLCGTPAVTLPILQGASGMPLGAQLVGRRGADGKLLRTARWLGTLAEMPSAGTLARSAQPAA